MWHVLIKSFAGQQVTSANTRAAYLCLPLSCLLPLFLQAVTNFATTANGVLASTFLLYSVGLGAGAIPTAGALNWVLKDGLGQMGTLLFGKAIAHNFDIHSKTWYFMSFLLLSTATGEAGLVMKSFMHPWLAG
jgi:hypothetical protein